MFLKYNNQEEEDIHLLKIGIVLFSCLPPEYASSGLDPFLEHCSRSRKNVVSLEDMVRFLDEMLDSRDDIKISLPRKDSKTKPESVDEYLSENVDLKTTFVGYGYDGVFFCSICGKETTFDEKEELRDHISREHGIDPNGKKIFDRSEIYEEALSLISDDTSAESFKKAIAMSQPRDGVSYPDEFKKMDELFRIKKKSPEMLTLLEIPLSDAEATVLLLKFFIAKNLESQTYIKKEKKLDERFTVSDLFLVPDDIDELLRYLEVGEKITGSWFEISRIIKDHDLSNEELRALGSTAVSEIAANEDHCFQIKGKERCGTLFEFKTQLHPVIQIDLKDTLRTADGEPMVLWNISSNKDRLKEKGILVKTSEFEEKSLFNHVKKRSGYSLDKKIWTRLLSPVFDEDRFESKRYPWARSIGRRPKKPRKRGSRMLDRNSRRLRQKDQKEEKTPEIPEVSFDDVILPEDVKKRIKNSLLTPEEEEIIYDKWGLGEKLNIGPGQKLLFSGPPGTGKTFTAKAIANEINRPLVILDLSREIDCYLGKTGENISKKFEMCEEKNFVLLIDECDAIIGKRTSESRNAENEMDRVSNVLLQEMEKRNVTLIMTTNLATKLDKALESRLSDVILFEKPDEEIREKLWRSKIPEDMPIAEDVDITKLAKKYELTGRGIRNAVLNAAKREIKTASSGDVKISISEFENSAKEECMKDEGFGYDLNMDKDESEAGNGLYV